MYVVVLAGTLASMAIATAWACTPQAFITLDPPPPRADGTSGAYRPGETVTLTGRLFVPNGSAKLRIGSTGPVVAEAAVDAEGTWTASFELAAKMARGTYFLLAEVRGTDGQIVRTATAPLQVETLASPLDRNLGPTAEHRPADEARTPPSRSPDPGAFPRLGRVTPESAAPQPAAVGPAAPVFESSRSAEQPERSESPAQPAESSKSPAQPREESSGKARGASVPPAPAPSERSAASDLWSGFGTSESRSLPRLDASSPAAGGRPASLLALGMALLGTGLAALLAGLVLAQVRRRRVLSRAGTRPPG